MRPYQLHTQNYFSTGNSINPNCLIVLPLEPKKKFQRFVIGDTQCIQIWGQKKGEFIQEFKSEAQQKEISKVVLSGSAEKFSIFYAAGQSIRGVTKKGKEFFKLDTSHTEVIKSLYVQSQSLWSAGEYILNCYESVNNKIVDKFFYICEDKINDMVVAPVAGQLVLNPILACQDKQLRILNEDKVLYNHKFDSACTAMSLATEQTHRHSPIIGYGLKNGGLGCIELTRDEPVVMWNLESSQTNGSSVSIIKCCKLTNEDHYDLVVARDNGYIEIYSYEHQNPVPTLRYETQLEEQITGIDFGYITSSTKLEVLITCYSGKVISLTDKKSNKLQSSEPNQSQNALNKENQDKVSSLSKEVEQLKKKIAEHEQQEAQVQNKNDNAKISNYVDYGEQFNVSHKINIIPQEAAYSLYIDSQISIDMIMLQSQQNIDILNVKDNLGQLNKVQDQDNSLLATLKVSSDNSEYSRVELKIRTSEGQLGQFNVFVMPKASTGNKTCQVIDVSLKPLNLHERIDHIESEKLEQLPLTVLKLTGKFSLSDAHNWVSSCLPEFPPNAGQEDSDEIRDYYYKSLFIGSYLILQLSNGQIIAKSDNISVVTIIKEQLTQEASSKKINVDVESEIEVKSIFHTLDLIHPLVLEQYEVAKKFQLIDGLKELQMHEEDTSFLSDEYKEILRDAEIIKQQHQQQPKKLQYLWGIIADLYIDASKMKGHHNVKNKMGGLRKILNQYNYNELIEYFQRILLASYQDHRNNMKRIDSQAQTKSKQIHPCKKNNDSYQKSFETQSKTYKNSSEEMENRRASCYSSQFENSDVLYLEENDGEILIEYSPKMKDLQLITCIDISTLYKEKRGKAIDIAKEYSKLQHINLMCFSSKFTLKDKNGTLIFQTEAPDHIACWKSFCKKSFNTDDMICIFRQLCEGLAYMHDQGIIHRDVHPTRIHCYYGITKFNFIGMPYNYKKLLKKDNFCGHVNYSAPELILERTNFTPKVDVWSLGCCLYYLCTKKDPFEGRNPQEIKQNIMIGKLEKYPSKIDPIIKSLIHKCLEKDEEKRLSASELIPYIDDLEKQYYGEHRSKKQVNQIYERSDVLYQQFIQRYLQSQRQNIDNRNSNYYKYSNPLFFMYPKNQVALEDFWPHKNINQQINKRQTSSYTQQRQVEDQYDMQQASSCQQYQSNNNGDLKAAYPHDRNEQYSKKKDRQNQQSSERSDIQIQDSKQETDSSFSLEDPKPTITQENKHITNQGRNNDGQEIKSSLLNSNSEDKLQVDKNLAMENANSDIKQLKEVTNVKANNSSDCIVQTETEPFSIFTTDFIFQQTEDDKEGNSKTPEQEVSMIEDNSYQSSNHTQNCTGKQNTSEAKNIAASILSSYGTVKNEVNFQDGTKFIGELMRHGKGIHYALDGSIYDGEWLEDKKSGYGKILFPDGAVYEGQWEDDKIHGKGIFISSNRDRYEGYFENSLKSGHGVMKFQNGDSYEGQWKNDAPNGQGVFKFCNGNVYEGRFVNGQFEGYGQMYFEGIGTYKGSFSEGNIEGNGNFIYLNGSKYDGAWNDNKRDGFGEYIEVDGNSIYKGYWQNDEKHGRGTFIQKGMCIIEGRWQHGIMVEMTRYQDHI